MPKFKVKVEWSGYSRGFSEYLVEADSQQEALEIYDEVGELVNTQTVRDDTERGDILNVKEVV